MNKKYLSALLIIIFSCSILTSACGGRTPKPSRSQKLITKHFKKYAKKYPETIYGQSGVKKVEIESQEEVRRKYTSVEAFVILTDGTVRKIYATLRKTSLGWRFDSWEDATGN
jgi:hypothetical protein